MDRAAYGARGSGERGAVGGVHVHRDEAEPHDGDYSVAERFRGIARVLLREDVDEGSREIGAIKEAVHETGEHRHSDLRCCRQRNCVQW